MILDTYPQALVLSGPTGSGKSALALELAEQLNAEIVSMDSMALYRGMDIGTAKPTADERRRVPHHLIDVLDPWESASVAWWLGRATICCRGIVERGKRPLFVGGTPLYLKAMLHGLFDGPPGDESIRRRLATEDGPSLHARLAVVDPVSAARLHPNDLRRLIRALEVWELTGRPISAWQTQWKAVSARQWRPMKLENLIDDSRFTIQEQARCLWLDLARSELYARIDARVERMVAEGLVEEVRALRQLERPLSREAGQALGYPEMFDHLDGRIDRAEAIRRIQTRSRQFAKRQITWFRHLPSCRAVSPQLTFALWGLTIKR
jgi:tRNA dimethylallyltransferase